MTPIERAARAAAQSYGFDESAWDALPDVNPVPNGEWDKRGFLGMARAILEAIREPDERHVATVKAEGVWNCAQDEIGGIYTEMIDAALKEG